jgi:hypothetical protein
VNTNLLDDSDYTESFFVLYRALPELIEASKDNKFIHPWQFVRKYPDLLKAEKGLQRLKENAAKETQYKYKIVQFTIKAVTRG